MTTLEQAPAASTNGRGPERTADTAILGAGFSGLGMAIRLKQEGFEDFVILERGDDVGGTWWFNTYPGCQCDIPSHLYSFSFAPNPEWTHTYSGQPEIQSYLRGCAERFGLLEHIRFENECRSAELLCECVEACAPSGEQAHLGPSRSEATRNRAAENARGAGDHGDSALETEQLRDGLHQD